MPEASAPIALRFVNTGRGRDGDLFGAPPALVAWIAAECPETAPNPSPPEARELFDEARRLRTAFDAVLAATAAGRPIPAPALALVERALAAGSWRRRVSTLDGRLSLSTTPMPSRAPLAWLAPLAASLVTVAAGTDPDRLRSCAAEDCGRWFVDTSRGGQRRWCSMDSCGNRAKAARWRSRHSSGD